MALILPAVFIVFTVSSFTKSNCHDFIANDEPPVHPTYMLLMFACSIGGVVSILKETIDFDRLAL